MKALFPIDVTEFGIVTDVMFEQLEKASSPIDIAPSAIIIDRPDEYPLKIFVHETKGVLMGFPSIVIVISEQFSKTELPNEFTDEGIVIAFRFEQPENAFCPIDDTESGINIDFRLEQPSKTDSPIAVTPSARAIVTSEQPSKAPDHEKEEDFTGLPLRTIVKPEQPVNAPVPIVDTDEGIIIEFTLKQYEKAFLPIDVTPSAIAIVKDDV